MVLNHTRITENSFVRLFCLELVYNLIILTMHQANWEFFMICQGSWFQHISTQRNHSRRDIFSLHSIIKRHDTTLTKAANENSMVGINLTVWLLTLPKFNLLFYVVLDRFGTLLHLLKIENFILVLSKSLCWSEIIPRVADGSSVDSYWSLWGLDHFYSNSLVQRGLRMTEEWHKTFRGIAQTVQPY